MREIPFDEQGRVPLHVRNRRTLGYVRGFVDAGATSATLTTASDTRVIHELICNLLFAPDADAYALASVEMERSQHPEFLEGYDAGRADYDKLEAAYPDVSIARTVRYESRQLLTPALDARLKEFATRPAIYGHREFQRFREVCMDVVKIERNVTTLRQLQPLFPGAEEGPGRALGGRSDHSAYRKLETCIRTGRVDREEAREFVAEMFGEKYRKHMDYLFDAIGIVMAHG